MCRHVKPDGKRYVRNKQLIVEISPACVLEPRSTSEINE